MIIHVVEKMVTKDNIFLVMTTLKVFMTGTKVVKSMALMASWRLTSKIKGFQDAIEKKVNGGVWRLYGLYG